MAGGAYKADEDDAITDINVTPFVDVALVLLVVFLVTAKFIVGRGIIVDKPKSAVGSEIPSTLHVVVDKAGKLYVNNTEYDSDAAAVARIAEIAATMPDPKAIITGDTNANYGAIMRAITVTKQAKVDKIALENEPAKGEQ